MIFEDTYEHSINRQEYENKQRKNHKEEKTNRTKFVVEVMMTIKLACIIILLSNIACLDLENTVPEKGIEPSDI